MPETTPVPISISEIKAGDTIRFSPGVDLAAINSNPRGVAVPGEDLLITRTWYVEKTQSHALQLDRDHGDHVLTFPYGPAILARLVDRPDCGPFDHVYQVGDRVKFRWSGRENLLGIVVSVTEDPCGSGPHDTCYEMRTLPSGLGYATPKSMRPEGNPRVRPGQIWEVTPDDRPKRRAQVVSVDDFGLVAHIRFDNGDVGNYLLAEPWWRMVEDAPSEPAAPVAPFVEVDTEICQGDDLVRLSRSVRVF